MASTHGKIFFEHLYFVEMKMIRYILTFIWFLNLMTMPLYHRII